MKEINIHKKIADKRKEKGITQEELAAYIGITKASVSKWETGQSYPDIQADPEKAKRIGHNVKGDSEVHVVKNMDHSLKRFEGEFRALEFKKNYEEGAGKPLHPMLEEKIVNWMNTYFISQYASNKALTSKLDEYEEDGRKSNCL